MTAERDWRGLLFVAPFVALYALILIFPLLRGLWLSFHQVDLFGAGHFVAFDNYIRLAADPVFARSMMNTFIVTLMIVPPLTVIALLLALALNNAGRSAAVLRGVFFSSAVLSVTIVTLIWRFVLAPDAGLLGENWQGFGWEPLAFLSDADLVLPAYEWTLKCSHVFNTLDARGAISVTERAAYIGRVRTLARAVAQSYHESRRQLGFPMIAPEALAALGEQR